MILESILEVKRDELRRAKAAVSESALRERELYEKPRRGFLARLGEHQGRRIIAEIKKASPSKGLIREHFEAPAHARDYQAAGACCISVLTDEKHFLGSLSDLEEVRAACSLPLLRKDFVIDGYQIVEARSFGADAVLLIVAALDGGLLGELSDLAAAEGLDVLVEVHDEAELETALGAGSVLVGVNNRNLRTFETSINVTRCLAALLPDEVTAISESGLRHPHELGQLEALGIDAFLIGESFMAVPDPGAELRRFLSG